MNERDLLILADLLVDQKGHPRRMTKENLQRARLLGMKLQMDATARRSRRVVKHALDAEQDER